MSLFYSLGLWIVTAIYHVVAYAFEIFLILASGQLLTSDSYKLLMENFYVVIGVIMLFFLAFSLLRGMVNPDDKKQGTSVVRKVIVNLVTSFILMILLPTIFSFAFDFQDAVILRQNSIGRFFGYGGADNINGNTQFKQIQQGTNQITNGVFTAFFNVNSDYCKKVDYNGVDSSEAMKRLEICQESVTSGSSNFKETINEVDETASFGLYVDYADKIGSDKGLDFNFILGLIGGLILIYVAVSFCFDMAVRLVKLVFYQLIAPIPIFMRVIPEGKFSGVFGNWTKVTLTCYLEVYIRIFVFYFSVYLCGKIMETDFLNSIAGYSFVTWLLTKAFIIMGIITFMRQAPKLFSDVTGLDSGNMKLGIRDKLATGGAFTIGALAGGGATAFTRNGLGAIIGAKNKYKEMRDKGSTRVGAFTKTFLSGVGSTVAGGVSGAARGGYAGWNAKSASDMTKAAGTGAKGAVDAKDARAAYKARHGGTTTGALLGHVQDVGYNIGRWAGYNNVDSLVAENKLLDQISSERKAIDSEARALILDELEKGKTDDKINIGLGGKFSIQRLRDLKSAVDAAKSTRMAGESDEAYAQRISKAETTYSDYLKKWQDSLVDESLRGQSDWERMKSDPTKLKYLADMAKVRQASDRYRETVSRNLSVPYIAELHGATDIADKEKALTHSHDTLDKIKDVIKIHRTENERKINEANQRAADASGKKQ